jgi:hypothetical protein
VSADDWRIEIPIPAGTTATQEEALIHAAIDIKIDGDIDDMRGGIFKYLHMSASAPTVGAHVSNPPN